MTPRQKLHAKRIARRSYLSLCGALVKSYDDKVIKQLSWSIRKELTHICSLKHNSVLRSGYAKLKDFSWDVIWTELLQNTPTLVSLISAIIPRTTKAVKCTILSIILKQRHNKMALPQRIISLFFYGNSVHKSVCIHQSITNVCISVITFI